MHTTSYRPPAEFVAEVERLVSLILRGARRG